MKKNFLAKNKIGIFILSRYNSKRLKKKASLKILGKNLIEILVERLIKNFHRKNITICSSNFNNNKKFYHKIANKYNIGIFFGNEKNVLKRILDCIKLKKINHFVRVTGDNPLTDTESILKLAKEHIKNKNDYTYTESLPIGMRPEIYSIKALKKNYKYIEDLNSTEYLTYFFLRKDLYKIQNVSLKKKFKNQNMFSVSIDKQQDYLRLKKIFFNYKNIFLNTEKILNYIVNNEKKIKLNFKILLKTKKYNTRYIFDKKNSYILLK